MNPKHIELLWRVRQLSSMRLAAKGPPPDDAQVWWSQITTVAAEANIELPTWEQWHSINQRPEVLTP